MDYSLREGCGDRNPHLEFRSPFARYTLQEAGGGALVWAFWEVTRAEVLAGTLVEAEAGGGGGEARAFRCDAGLTPVKKPALSCI